MPALTINSTNVPVRPGGHSQGWESLGSADRAGSGRLRSSVTATLGRVKVWRFETHPMVTATGETIETLLRTMGQVEADGYLVGDTPFQVYVRNLARSDVPDARKFVLTFELYEVST